MVWVDFLVIFISPNIFLKKIFILSCVLFSPKVLLFPEGTNLTKETKSQSDEFAEKNGLQKYSQVLHPRKAGFSFLASKLQKGNYSNYN